jgi:sugar lactone lactonase YvrE
MRTGNRHPLLAVVIGTCFLGLACADQPQYPVGIAVDKSQAIYLADRNLPGIWLMKDGKIAPYFTGSKKFRTPLNAVRCVAIDNDGKLLAGDSATREVYRFDAAGKPTPLTNGGIGIPMSIACAKNGDLFVADLELHSIWKVAQGSEKPTTFVAVLAPRALFLDDQEQLWVVSHGNNQLLKVNAEGKTEVVVKGRPFEFPSAVVVNDEGVAFVCDTYAKAIWRVSPGKMPEKWVSGEPLVSPVGLAWQEKNLLVVDPRAKGLVRVSPTGEMEKIPYASVP